MSFHPDSIKTFRFGEYAFDEASKEARFSFFLDSIRFEERLRFIAPGETPALTKAQRAALDRALNIASAIIGVSYYKAAAPKKIEYDALRFGENEARLINDIWLHGLGEFAHMNGLDLAPYIRFQPNCVDNEPIPLGGRKRILVPIGGGKDSMVTLEELRINHEVCAFQLGNYTAINRMIDAANVPSFRVERRIDPSLFRLNEQGALNGHIPITAIYSITAVMATIIGGYSTVALSAERSADEANLTDFGRDINHQWSKGLQFETAFQRCVQQGISADIDYFSWLRPFSELHIARKFSALSQYHDTFSSCNRSFHLDGARIKGRWCRQCPKCRFVFLILSPWIEPHRLIEIFGSNLLNDPKQQKGFEELLGISHHKPFECVGEYAECAVALQLAAAKPEIANAYLTPRLLEAIRLNDNDFNRLKEQYLTPSTKHAIPNSYMVLPCA